MRIACTSHNDTADVIVMITTITVNNVCPFKQVAWFVPLLYTNRHILLYTDNVSPVKPKVSSVSAFDRGKASHLNATGNRSLCRRREFGM